jgi:hypothetical protein
MSQEIGLPEDVVTNRQGGRIAAYSSLSPSLTFYPQPLIDSPVFMWK